MRGPGHGLRHLALKTRDIRATERFYIDVLGMTVAHENERQCFLHCGNGQQIALFLSRDGGDIHAGSEMNHIALRLESGEYDEVKARLEAEGCTITGRTGDPNCIYFSDPDGHRLQLITLKEQAGEH